MYLQRLKLTNFRNYEFQELSFPPHLNLVAGMNGMGKTNLLDAVYYLCMGKSHFTNTDRNVVLHGEPFFRLEGYFVEADLLLESRQFAIGGHHVMGLLRRDRRLRIPVIITKPA